MAAESKKDRLTRKIIHGAEMIRVSSAQVQRLETELQQAKSDRDERVREHREDTLELAALVPAELPSEVKP